YTTNTQLYDGAFGQNSMTRLLQVSDGTSNTVAVGERIRSITNVANYPETGQNADAAATYGTWAMGTPVTANAQEQAVGSTGNPFNHVPANPADRFSQTNTAGCYSSKHTGGINFVFLDATVHFLNANTNDSVRLAIGTIAGNEVVSLDP